MPTEPGYYWARLRVTGSELATWQPVEINRGTTGELVIFLFGIEDEVAAKHFVEWGPRIEPPK